LSTKNAASFIKDQQDGNLLRIIEKISSSIDFLTYRNIAYNIAQQDLK